MRAFSPYVMPGRYKRISVSLFSANVSFCSYLSLSSHYLSHTPRSNKNPLSSRFDVKRALSSSILSSIFRHSRSVMEQVGHISFLRDDAFQRSLASFSDQKANMNRVRRFNIFFVALKRSLMQEKAQPVLRWEDLFFVVIDGRSLLPICMHKDR